MNAIMIRRSVESRCSDTVNHNAVQKVKKVLLYLALYYINFFEVPAIFR